MLSRDPLVACRSAGLGGAPKPKRDLHRFVKWPQYVRLQRQKRVLSMRLKVPPVINQFVTRALDKNAAETAFKLMMKYRPEDKKQKADRLKAEAAAREAGKEVGAWRGASLGLCAHNNQLLLPPKARPGIPKRHTELA